MILARFCGETGSHEVITYANPTNLVRKDFFIFMYMEWSEEKFSKGIVGDKTRLRF